MQWYCKITNLKSNLKQNESQKHIFKLPMVFTRYEFSDLQDDLSLTQVSHWRALLKDRYIVNDTTFDISRNTSAAFHSTTTTLQRRQTIPPPPFLIHPVHQL